MDDHSTTAVARTLMWKQEVPFAWQPPLVQHEKKAFCCRPAPSCHQKHGRWFIQKSLFKCHQSGLMSHLQQVRCPFPSWQVFEERFGRLDEKREGSFCTSLKCCIRDSQHQSPIRAANHAAGPERERVVNETQSNGNPSKRNSRSAVGSKTQGCPCARKRRPSKRLSNSETRKAARLLMCCCFTCPSRSS